MWRAFAWGFDAVGCSSLQPRVKVLPPGSSKWWPMLGQVSLSIVCSLNRVSCKGRGVLSLA